MYGLVNRAVEDLIISTEGKDVWQQIKIDAGVGDVEFLDSCNYDDSLTFELVAAVSARLDQPPEAVLQAFGRHWVLYTGREGWASVFGLAGDDMVSFLNGLDDMHARVQVAMPDAVMPQFKVINLPEYFWLEYHSARAGLAPMVYGMLEGLAEQFDEFWNIELISPRSESGFDTFQLTRVQKNSKETGSHAA